MGNDRYSYGCPYFKDGAVMSICTKYKLLGEIRRKVNSIETHGESDALLGDVCAILDELEARL